MPVTYTNRKGITYTLCRSTTKAGKPRYTFVRDPAAREVVEEIPEGWEIRVSVNGIVSLAKERPQAILPKGVAAVEAAIEKHPKSHNYRFDVKPDRIVAYERVGPDAEDLILTSGRLCATLCLVEEENASQLLPNWRQMTKARGCPDNAILPRRATRHKIGRLCFFLQQLAMNPTLPALHSISQDTPQLAEGMNGRGLRPRRAIAPIE